MVLSSFKFVQWAPKYASILEQSAGRRWILTSNSHSQGHSRSFLLQSVAVDDNSQCRLTPPPRRTPREYPHGPYISRN